MTSYPALWACCQIRPCSIMQSDVSTLRDKKAHHLSMCALSWKWLRWLKRRTSNLSANSSVYLTAFPPRIDLSPCRKSPNVPSCHGRQHIEPFWHSRKWAFSNRITHVTSTVWGCGSSSSAQRSSTTWISSGSLIRSSRP